jgi:hypothetical protein
MHAKKKGHVARSPEDLARKKEGILDTAEVPRMFRAFMSFFSGASAQPQHALVEILVSVYSRYNGPVGDLREHSARYTLLDWFSWLDQTLRYLGRNYSTATVQVPVSRIHTTFSLTGIVNVSDHSFVIDPWITVQWTQWLAVDVYGAVTLGDDRTDEYASMGQTGYLRLRFSF